MQIYINHRLIKYLNLKSQKNAKIRFKIIEQMKEVGIKKDENCHTCRDAKGSTATTTNS